jgi:hypothetical protein
VLFRSCAGYITLATAGTVMGVQLPEVMFAIALGVGVLSIFANVYVYVRLRRLGAPVRHGLGGMPNYLLRVCADLPPSPTRSRLVRTAWWATLGFLVAFLLGVIMGPLVAGGSHG